MNELRFYLFIRAYSKTCDEKTIKKCPNRCPLIIGFTADRTLYDNKHKTFGHLMWIVISFRAREKQDFINM